MAVVKPQSYGRGPKPAKRVGTLLDTATVESGIEWVEPRGLTMSLNCIPIANEIEFCPVGPVTDKQFPRQTAYNDGVRFAAYMGLECGPIGNERSEWEDAAREAWALKESTAVERALMNNRFRGSNPLPAPSWSAPTDVTPGAAVSPEVGMALLEAHGASEYGGQITIHSPTSVASLLAANGRINSDGNRFYSSLGSKFIAGAGYEFPSNGPTGTAAPVTERWMYGTGEVLIHTSDLIFRNELNHRTNDDRILLERLYIASIDCWAAAVRVTLS